MSLPLIQERELNTDHVFIYKHQIHINKSISMLLLTIVLFIHFQTIKHLNYVFNFV